MTAAKPSVLLLQPHLAFLGRFLDPHFTVWRFWEHPPLEAQGTIEALVTAGEFAVDKALAESLPRLSLIACFTSGYDGVDVAWARGRGLKVTHSPRVNHEDVADHALGLLLGAWRRIAEGDRQVRQEGAWKADAKRLTPSLGGRRVGIVGLGEIGAAVARRCAAFGLEIAWWGPREKPDAPWPRRESLMDLALWCDILVVACRAEASNRGLISREVIQAVGAEGLIVNVARGQLIDEEALIAALKDGTLGMAGLDVFIGEPTAPQRWEAVPNTVLTPHTAGATTTAGPRMVALTVETLRRHFAGEELPNEAPA